MTIILKIKMYKKIIFILLAVLLVLPQITFGEDSDTNTSVVVHPCETAWNDKMQEYDNQYNEGLHNLLYQKKRTSKIIDSEAVSYNLRSHNCRMHQICEVVNFSLYPEEAIETRTVIGKMMRCQETPVSEFGGYFEECGGHTINSQTDTFALWSKCVEQAEERIEYIEKIVTKAKIIESNAAKKTSNLVEYLTKSNKKLDALAIDTGGMIGILFDVTRKMTCVQKTCSSVRT